MFKRWIILLCGIAALVAIATATQFYFSSQRYNDYAYFLDQCNAFEDKMLASGQRDWSLEDRAWWDGNCDHASQYSYASMAYATFRDVNSNFENIATALLLLIAVILVSFMGKWLYTGRIKW